MKMFNKLTMFTMGILALNIGLPYCFVSADENSVSNTGEFQADVVYTTKTQTSDPENPDSPSYILQIPSGFHFTQKNEPENGQELGDPLDGEVKLLNANVDGDFTPYSGAKTVRITISSKNNFKLKDSLVKNDKDAAEYKLAGKSEPLEEQNNNYTFKLNKEGHSKELVAALTKKSQKAGQYSDVLTFTYQNIDDIE